MPCYKPLTAYWSKYLTENGKRQLVFNAKLALNTDFKIQVPCGRCIGCRLEYARVWGLRCWHESLLYDNNCFLTLTYDDDHLPDWHSLDRDHFTNFIKRLREYVRIRCIKEKIPLIKIRYFGCGEYGDKSQRPHYHSIIFNFDFPDKKFLGFNKNGDMLYTSNLLTSLWPYGLHSIGGVSFKSASYVARYVMKKIFGEASSFYLDHCLLPPFIAMSRKPGLGREWFEKNRTQIEDHLFVRTEAGVNSPVPRYYTDQFSDSAKIRLESHKIDNILSKVNSVDFDYFSFKQVLLKPERADVLETVKQRQICDLCRNLNE